jgi:hypothetical protein
MPLSCKKIGQKWRLVEPDGSIAKTDKGSARDGGGHSSKKACSEQAAAINAAASESGMIHADVASIDWITAAEDEAKSDAPKRFKMRAYNGGPLSIGFYSSPIVIDMAGLTAKPPLPILMNHDLDRIVGHAETIEAKDSTLDLAGVISGASPEAAQVIASAKLGFPWKASVGVRPDKMEFVGEGIVTKVNGKTLTGLQRR